MASPDNTSYFIRVRGRVLGPYTVPQLKTLRGRGQFSRANEVSTDRLNWQSATSIEHLFGNTSKAAQPEESSTTEAGPPSRSVKPSWHYAVGSEEYGPVTLVELRGLLKSGQLTEDDLVWKDGLPDWVPVCEVAELNSITKSAATAPVAQRNTSGQTFGNFCFACGSPTDARAEICPACGVRQSNPVASKKDRITAALLAFFLGGLGVHHFYLGNTVLGIFYVLFCWTLIPALIAFIEFIVLLCMSDAKFNAKYASVR